MELSYYLRQAGVGADLIINQVNYGSLYDFSANLNVDTIFDDAIDETIEDYVCFFTFERRRYHSQILYTNYSPGGTGYCIGINSTNQIFIDYPLRGFCHTFPVRMGNKNCIAIKKNGNSFTLYKYDLISGVIEDSSLITIEEQDVYNNISYGTIRIAGDSNYAVIPENNSSIKFFSGFFDQFVMIKAALEESLINIIFKGFRPETLTPLVSYNITNSNNYTWLSDEIRQYKTHFDDAYKYLDEFLMTGSPGLSTGNFIAIEDATFSSSVGFEIDIAYHTGINGCSLGGSVSPGGAAYYYSTLPGGIPNYTYISDTHISKYSGRMSVSREVTMTLSGTGYKFHYNSAYFSQSSTTGYSSSFDNSYYNNIKMDGVFSDKYLLAFLYSGVLQAGTGYHIRGEYDFVKDSFFVPLKSSNASFYLNGQPEIYGYIDGDYIVITGSGAESVLEYDNNNNYSLLNTYDNANHLSGRFNQGVSRVIESNDYNNLVPGTDYVETSSGHMYHLMTYQPTGSKLLFVL